jgi:hypothetical protein
VICLRPKDGILREEPVSVVLMDEDAERWLAYRLNHAGEEELAEYPKYAWEKVREGVCPAVAVRRRFAPLEEEALALAVAANGNAIARETIVKPEELKVRTGPSGRQVLEFRGVELTRGDRVLIWLWQNRAAAAAATILTTPAEITSAGIVDGTGIDRATLSQVLGQLERLGLVKREKKRVIPDGRVVVDAWTLTGPGLEQTEMRVRGGVYPSMLPPVEALPELAERRALTTVRKVFNEQGAEIRDLVRVGEDLRVVDRMAAAARVEQSELHVRQSQIELLAVIRLLGGASR